MINFIYIYTKRQSLRAHTRQRGDKDMKKTIEELLEAPCWVIDILPKQVPVGSAGQFFTIDKYYLGGDQQAAIKRKHINTVLKLNCYVDISIDNGETWNPDPHQLVREMRRRWFYIMLEEAMILTEPDDTHMSLFNPSEELLDLVRQIAASEGLFVWKSPNA